MNGISTRQTIELLGLQGNDLVQWARRYIKLQFERLAGQHDGTCQFALAPAEMSWETQCTCPAGVRWLDLTCKQRLLDEMYPTLVAMKWQLQADRLIELVARPLQYEAAILISDTEDSV